jgi:beta-1,4-mannosyltransferase
VLDRATADDSRLRVTERFLDDDELARVIRAADHVVLPYRRVLNSGSALLALTLGRPVLLPRTPTFEALRTRLGAGWVSLFDAPLQAAELAAAAVPAEEAPDLSWCDWERVSEQISALLRSGRS